jgi:hypothetical protein
MVLYPSQTTLLKTPLYTHKTIFETKFRKIFLHFFLSPVNSFLAETLLHILVLFMHGKAPLHLDENLGRITGNTGLF